MKVLVDTHTFLWWSSKPEALSLRAKTIIADPANILLFSVASLWEIIIKTERRRLQLPLAPVEYVRSRVEHGAMQFLPITLSHVAALEGLPRHHGDPFDRLLIAQALAEGIPILTRDEQIEAYPVKTIW